MSARFLRKKLLLCSLLYINSRLRMTTPSDFRPDGFNVSAAVNILSKNGFCTASEEICFSNSYSSSINTQLQKWLEDGKLVLENVW